MRLRQRGGHSSVLDTAAASLGLMSQRVDGGLMRAIAPHTTSYFDLLLFSFFFNLSSGKSQELYSLLSGIYFRNFPTRTEMGLQVCETMQKKVFQNITY